MTSEYRIENDGLGPVKIPVDAPWGPHTQRAINNFKISNLRFPPEFLEMLLKIKKTAALANMQLGIIDKDVGTAIVDACNHVLENKNWDYFPLDIFQSGSGTQTNMNANEVIANLATKILKKQGINKKVHPNDHVNKCQSSNDVIPATMYLSISLQIKKKLLPRLKEFAKTLEKKKKEFKSVIKIGRTHLQDAVPMTLGHVFGGYLAQVEFVIERLSESARMLLEVPLGGTAVGIGTNAHPSFSKVVSEELSRELGEKVRISRNKIMDIAAHDKILFVAGTIKTLASVLTKIANDLRWLASGPRAGIGELILPANEFGSSIMPGKINPTQAESLMQVAMKVMGNMETLMIANAYGSQFELNTAKPLMIHEMLQSITILSNGIHSFNEKLLKGVKANLEKNKLNVENSLMLATLLAPLIGYDEAAKIAKEAHEKNKTIKEIVLEKKLFTPEEVEEILKFNIPEDID